MQETLDMIDRILINLHEGKMIKVKNELQERRAELAEEINLLNAAEQNAQRD